MSTAIEQGSKYERRITLDIGFEIQYAIDESGLYNCYIPSIDSYYNAKDLSAISHNGRFLVMAFMKHWTKALPTPDIERERDEKVLREFRDWVHAEVEDDIISGIMINTFLQTKYKQ